tara:strand:- start:4135 stop:5172 length:1038 start_codon:yes stop_codon:yes gene_type:complete
MNILKTISYNILFFFIAIVFIEIFFGYWFKEENFGIYMRKERKINWQTSSTFNEKEYNFFYKRNYWGFRGEEFDAKNVKIIFEGGSTGNQRYTPEELTIVALINKKFRSFNQDIKIFNASTDGKSVNGYINDFNFWFPKIPNLNIEYVIFFIGINDRYIYDYEESFWDNKISKRKIDQIKDYIKNNSIFVDKFKFLKNRYFPTNTLAYNFNNKSLYTNFEYIDYKKASILHKNLDNEDLIFINQYRLRLEKLKSIIERDQIKPIFITQLKFDGIKEKRLFLINNELKDFANKNEYFLIPLDEILVMEINDYYDELHTTPQGSIRIANKVFPILLDFFEKNGEIRK